VPEAADDLHARALAAADSDGRLPMPPVADWETFPFEGDIRVRPFRPPEDEQPRLGEDPSDCWRCRHGDADAIRSDARWLVTPLERPSGLPVVVILQPRAHCDLGDLPAELAAELGPLLVRVERAVDAVGRSGASTWTLGRRQRAPPLLAHGEARTRAAVAGSFAAIWDDIVPPLPEEPGARTSSGSRGRSRPAGAAHV
jgi:hypothetical protein